VGHGSGDEHATEYVQLPPLRLLVQLIVPRTCGSLTILGFFFLSCSGSTATALTHTPTAFEYAFAFNADISKWVTGRVTDMEESTSNVLNCLFHELVVL